MISEKKENYSKEYLTIVSLADNNKIRFSCVGGGTVKTIEVSTDKINWTTKTSVANTSIELATLNTGDKLYVRGNNRSYASSNSVYHNINGTYYFDLEGNIMSLLYGDNFATLTALEEPYTFGKIFENCGVNSAKNLILPATTLQNFCYYSMFADCFSLSEAPEELPATILTTCCYQNMFHNCGVLTIAPELPATTLASSCYHGMFAYTSLTTAPKLPATTLYSNSYMGMFQGCTSLTTVPDLSATTLGFNCCSSMFRDCTALTIAPKLPATTLVDYCYQYMFYNCNKLTRITCLATNIPVANCTTNWVYNVKSSGIFTKASSMSNWTTGTSAIPSGWTVQNA